MRTRSSGLATLGSQVPISRRTLARVALSPLSRWTFSTRKLPPSGLMREYTSNRQNPTSDKANYDPDMLLAYVPSKARPAAAPAPKFGTLIFESNMDGVEVFVDGKTIGVLDKGKPVSAPGLAPGEHTVQGVKMGYEPDGPRQEMVYPGQESPVKIRILIPRRRNKAAADLLQEGIKFYLKGNEQDYKKAVDLFERA